MSSLWTPSGERPIRRTPPDAGSSSPSGQAGGPQTAAPGDSAHTGSGAVPRPGPAPAGEYDDLSVEERAELDAQLAQARQRLLSAPPEIIVANHCYGLFELAVMYLSARPPVLDGARLSIDALAGVLDGVGDRLGEATAQLRDALTQMRLAVVEIQGATEPGSGASGHAAPPTAPPAPEESASRPITSES